MQRPSPTALPGKLGIFVFCLTACSGSKLSTPAVEARAYDSIQAVRLDGNPILDPDLDPTLTDNINGPSLIRVPDWVPEPLGRYYLYFASHQGGQYIRLAYADQLSGPWAVYPPGIPRVFWAQQESSAWRTFGRPFIFSFTEPRPA